MLDRQIAMVAAVPLILAVMVALWRQGVIGRLGLAVATTATLGVAAFVGLT